MKETLFRQLNWDVSLLLAGQKDFSLTEEEGNTYGIARKEFLSLIPADLTGAEFISQAYALYDSLITTYIANNPIACKSNCGYCCHQLVCCSELEMRIIADYLSTLPRPFMRKLKKSIAKESRRFLNYLRRITDGKLGKIVMIWEDIEVKVMLDWHGNPCPYLLENKNCGIYPVRPVDCRIAKTKVPCGTVSRKEDLQPVRLVIDQILSDVVTEESAKISGSMQVTPLAYWPLTDNFKNIC